MFNTVSSKRLAIFGFAFKKDTGDVRESPAIDICAALMTDGAELHVYDPKVKREDALYEFELHDVKVNDKLFVTSPSAEAAIDGAHAIVILTEWDEFRRYDYRQFYKKMMKP